MKKIQINVGNETRIKTVVGSLGAYNVMIGRKIVRFVDTGRIENGNHIYEMAISDEEQAYKDGKTIQYKSDDVDYWTDFEPLSEIDEPSFDFSLQWRVKQ